MRILQIVALLAALLLSGWDFSDKPPTCVVADGLALVSCSVAGAELQASVASTRPDSAFTWHVYSPPTMISGRVYADVMLDRVLANGAIYLTIEDAAGVLHRGPRIWLGSKLAGTWQRLEMSVDPAWTQPLSVRVGAQVVAADDSDYSGTLAVRAAGWGAATH